MADVYVCPKCRRRVACACPDPVPEVPTARAVVDRLIGWANERLLSKNGAIRSDGRAVKRALADVVHPESLAEAERRVAAARPVRIDGRAT